MTTYDRGPPILVVEDDEDTRSALRELLEAEGYPVVDAGDGRAALEVLTDDPKVKPQLIMLDLQLPIMSGSEFLAVVKSYTRLARIPVIVVSAGEPQPEAIARRTIVGWLQKPFDAASLTGLVKLHAPRHGES